MITVTNLTPKDIIEMKRVCDEELMLNEHLRKIRSALSIFVSEKMVNDSVNLFNINLPSDEQFAGDIKAALIGLEARKKEELSSLTLTLGGGEEV